MGNNTFLHKKIAEFYAVTNTIALRGQSLLLRAGIEPTTQRTV